MSNNFLSNFLFKFKSNFSTFSISPRTFALEIKSNFYNKSTVEELVRVVKESPISFFISYIVHRSSPFLQQLNIAVIRAREFGMIEHANLKVSTLMKMRRIDRYKKAIITYKKKPKNYDQTSRRCIQVLLDLRRALCFNIFR